MAERSRGSQLPGTYSKEVANPKVAAGTADTLSVWKNKTGATVKITGVGFVPDTAITGDDTNYMTLKLINKELNGAGTVEVTAAKSYTSGVDVTNFTEDSLTLSTTAANLLVDNGEVLALDKAEAAAGMDLPAGIIVLTFQYV